MHPVMLLPTGADTQALRKALWHYRIGLSLIHI
jgi:GlpG protein